MGFSKRIDTILNWTELNRTNWTGQMKEHTPVKQMQFKSTVDQVSISHHCDMLKARTVFCHSVEIVL